MYNFENKKTRNGIHYSRYIASYMKECFKRGKRFWAYQFKEWLRTEQLSEQEIDDICEMADCGKMELETKAYLFLKNRDTENRV